MIKGFLHESENRRERGLGIGKGGLTNLAILQRKKKRGGRVALILGQVKICKSDNIRMKRMLGRGGVGEFSSRQ